MPSSNAVAAGPNADQAQNWTSDTGRKWVLYQEKLDRLFSDVKAELLRRCKAAPGERVLDIGCGAGDTTLSLAGEVGPSGFVDGLDISDTLLALARERARGQENVAFTLGDAQIHEFGRGQYDLLTSRFGVMFFADPVAAFANLAAALRPGGSRAVFAAWGSMADNPWTVVPRAAAVARLGDARVEAPPGAPGQFAFADIERVTGILTAAGFGACSGAVMDIDLICDGGARDAAELAATFGPASRLMTDREATDADRAAIVEATSQAFSQYARESVVRVPARINIFSAVTP